MSKGQLLMRVQSSDCPQAFSDYQQAMADETLAKAQFERSKLLFDKGAIAQKDLEVAPGCGGQGAVTDADDDGRVSGCWAPIMDHPGALIDIYAPAIGVITEQNVTAAAGREDPGQLAEPVYDFRSLARSGSCAMCMRTIFADRAPGRVRRHSLERLSGPGSQGPHRQHRSDPGSQPPHGEGAPGSGKSRDVAAWACSSPPRSTA